MIGANNERSDLEESPLQEEVREMLRRRFPDGGSGDPLEVRPDIAKRALKKMRAHREFLAEHELDLARRSNRT